MKPWSSTSSLLAASALSMWGAATAALPGRFGAGASRRWRASTGISRASSAASPIPGLVTSVMSLVTCSPARLRQCLDLVSAVASLHHMDARAGLARLRDLVAPGGVLVVIGLARPDLPKDIPVELAAQVVRLVRAEPGKTDGTPKPPIIWPPPERYATMRRLAAELLPGARWHRHCGGGTPWCGPA